LDENDIDLSILKSKIIKDIIKRGKQRILLNEEKGKKVLKITNKIVFKIKIRSMSSLRTNFGAISAQFDQTFLIISSLLFMSFKVLLFTKMNLYSDSVLTRKEDSQAK